MLYANHPRETVSWYQAVAFTRWLSDKLGYEVRLPHEHEWEVAAKYQHGRTYPWGEDEFDSTKANTAEGGLGQTTAVGLYPTGRQSTLDLYDLSGNVLEWCQNKYNDPTQDEVDDSGDSAVCAAGRGYRFNHRARRLAPSTILTTATTTSVFGWCGAFVPHLFLPTDHWAVIDR
ncbi:MAG: SUMF1/EgtB/PvdO family nonheme iron enzyme [Chloroflexi bacterium]|nr:SUMF1/EgtB/PvdO family nonheme iron enzyme [Chloroflexota bacterium]